ncbi:MAG: NAD(P)-binding protein [Anaerolineae bacterium]|jgi:isorenieratene synthase|nr:NAD(P)-binding protein [Anaerolineae bacterium]
MPKTDNSYPVIIIGGGLAGLTAAVYLANADIPPLVLDADALWTGGRLAGGDFDSFTHNGHEWHFPPEHSVHALWGGYVNLRRLITEFTPTQLNTSNGEEWVNRWRRDIRKIEAGNSVRRSWIPAPFHYLQLLFRPRFWTGITPLDFLSLPGFLFSMGWTVGFDPLKEQTPLDGLSMREFFRGWTPNLRATFTGLGANLLAAPPDQISVASFIAALRFYTVLRRDAWQMQFFPSNSAYSLINPLVEFIESHDGRVWRGTTATQLAYQDGLWRITVDDYPNRVTRTLYAQHIIIATNAPSAQRLLMDSPTTAPLAQKIKFPDAISNVVVRMWFDSAPIGGANSGMFTGDSVIDNFFWLHRLYDEFADWGEMGYSALEVHLYIEEELLNRDDRHLLIVAVDEVQRAFPELKGHFVHGAVRRNSKNHTEFRIPTHDSLWVKTEWQNLYMAGDWVGYDTPSFWMERATVTGIASANHVLEAFQKSTIDILYPPPPELLARLFGWLVYFIRWLIRPILGLIRAIQHKRIKKL